MSEYLDAHDALMIVAARLADNEWEAGRLISERFHVGLLHAKARLVIDGDGRHENAPVEIGSKVSRNARMQWRWATGDLRVMDYHWQIGEHSPVQAYGIQFDQDEVEALAGSVSASEPKPLTIDPVSVDGLPEEWIDRMPDMMRQRAGATWWSWPEALAWVRTLNIEEVAAMQAWRHYLIERGERPEGGLLFVLIGASPESDLAKASLIEKLVADKIAAEGTDARGIRVAVPSTEWSVLKIDYRDTVHLAPPGKSYDARYCDLWFRREDVQREFPVFDVTPVTDTQSASSGFRKAKLPQKWIGKIQADYKPIMDEAARLVFERKASYFQPAVNDLVEKAEDILLRGSRDETAAFIYRNAITTLYTPKGDLKPGVEAELD